MRGRRLLAASLLGLLVLPTACRRKLQVEALHPRRGPIQESFTEPARTRLAKTYLVTMPVEGRVGRIDLEPGDKVTRGQTLADFDLVPLEAAVEEARAAVQELQAEIAVKEDNRLEETAAIEAKAMVTAADEAIRAADEEVAAEKARADHAARSLERKRLLAQRNVIAEEELDAAELLAATSLTELRKQQFYRAALKAFRVAVNLGPKAIEQYVARKALERQVLVHRLAQAHARLAAAEHRLKLARVVSPIGGVVLERHEQGDRPLPAGQALLLLGNLDQLEAVADVLTGDALRLHPGTLVEFKPALGRAPFPGKVKRIEPQGFTKLSSLGVEQQRVRVVVALERRPENLGVGYRLQARFLTAARDAALLVPRFSVLQAPDRTYYVLKIVEGRLARQKVELGLRTDLTLEVGSGLTERDTIVAKPDTTMEPGAPVELGP